MVRRGVDDLGAVAGLDGEVVQVGVAVNQDRGGRLGLVLAGPGVGCLDLLPGPEGRDRRRLARGEQDQGPRRERLTAAGRPVAAVPAARVVAAAARIVAARRAIGKRRLRRILTCPGGERRILQLSASLAAGTPVSP